MKKLIGTIAIALAFTGAAQAKTSDPLRAKFGKPGYTRVVTQKGLRYRCDYWVFGDTTTKIVEKTFSECTLLGLAADKTPTKPATAPKSSAPAA